MPQLILQDSPNQYPWSEGGNEFFVDVDWSPGNKLIVGVYCRLGNLQETELALLDTGASWSVIGPHAIGNLGNQLGPPLYKTSMHTSRAGKIDGDIHELNITLPSTTDYGMDVIVESRVFVSSDWKGPTVLGFQGFLGSLRFALDPAINPDDEDIFFFGPAA